MPIDTATNELTKYDKPKNLYLNDRSIVDITVLSAHARVLMKKGKEVNVNFDEIVWQSPDWYEGI